MSDIGIFANNEEGYTVSLGDSEKSVNGNVALINRFQIVFFDEGMSFEGSGGNYIIDEFGGRAFSILGIPKSLSNKDSISASITVAVDNTVRSIQAASDEYTPDTERLVSAELKSVDIIEGTVYATINITPKVKESLNPLQFKLPVTSRSVS